jgi:hypothetical protein
VVKAVLSDSDDGHVADFFESGSENLCFVKFVELFDCLRNY